jgi:uncharacterized SAM-binding protein YcdF (DUF218 family)
VLYYVSKCFWLIVQPVHLWFLLLAVGIGFVVARRRRIAFGVLAFDALLLLIVATLPVGSWLIAPLENRFPPLRNMPAHVDGVIMLGGNENVAFTDLARLYPMAKLVFAGGEPSPLNAVLDPASPPRGTPQWMGIDTGRITFESKSRNTFEDVAKAKAIVHPASGETWILVTNAFHMPRSVGLFLAQGWQVVPAPVGYQTGADSDDVVGKINVERNLRLLSVASKEWIGMFANRLLRHSQCFFPGPV